MATKPAEGAPVETPVQNTTELEVPTTMHIETPPAEPIEAAEERPVNPRDAIMKRIAENYEGKTRKHELEVAEGYASDARAAAGVEEPEAIVEPPVEVAPAPEVLVVAPPVETPSGPYRTLKVDGREVPVQDEEQLLSLARQGLSSNARYQVAAEMLNRAQSLAQQVAPQNPGQQPVQSVTPPAPPFEENKAREIARRLSYGSEDEQIAALRDLGQIVGQPSAPQVAPEQIAHYAKETAKAELRFESNIETIGKEFPSVFNDRGLTLLAADTLGHIRNRNVQMGLARPDIEDWREACQTIQQRYLRPAEAQPEPVSVAKPSAPVMPDDKLARKRAAPKLPSAVSATANLGTEKQPPTGSQIVAAIRAQRGQMAMN